MTWEPERSGVARCQQGVVRCRQLPGISRSTGIGATQNTLYRYLAGPLSSVSSLSLRRHYPLRILPCARIVHPPLSPPFPPPRILHYASQSSQTTPLTLSLVFFFLSIRSKRYYRVVVSRSSIDSFWTPVDILFELTLQRIPFYTPPAAYT